MVPGRCIKADGFPHNSSVDVPSSIFVLNRTTSRTFASLVTTQFRTQWVPRQIRPLLLVPDLSRQKGDAMATTSAPRVNGVNPGDRSKNVASDPLTELQGLWKAVQEISKDDGFSRFTRLFERVNSQEATLKDRDSKINELETRLAAQEASHSARNNEQFDGFEKRYQKWEKQKEGLRSEMESLTAATKEKDKTITTLQEELKKTKKQVVELEKSHDAMMKSNNNKNIQLGDLDARLQTALNIVNEQKAQLKTADDNLVTLTQSFESKVNENRKLQEDAAKATETISEYRGFPVKLEKLDMPKVSVVNSACFIQYTDTLAGRVSWSPCGNPSQHCS
jgi:myosin heavy subunit